MSEIENLFDEEYLVPNVKGAAFFILLYEHFEDVVISTVKEFYSSPCSLDGILYSSIDDEYIKALKDKIAKHEEDEFFPYKHQLKRAEEEREVYRSEIIRSKKNADTSDGKRFRGSLNWLQENNVFSKEEVERILQIRKRRNSIVHELIAELSKGLSDDDGKMIVELLEFNKRINSWRFMQIEVPILGYEFPEGATPEDVMGGDDTVLMGIFRILFLNEGKQFEEALSKLTQENVYGKKKAE